MIQTSSFKLTKKQIEKIHPQIELFEKAIEETTRENPYAGMIVGQVVFRDDGTYLDCKYIEQKKVDKIILIIKGRDKRRRK